VTTHLRTTAHLEQAVTPKSTINPDGSYVVPATIDSDGLSLTPAKHGLLLALQHKYEFLHFGYVTQWETFRRIVLLMYTKYYAMKIRRDRSSFFLLSVYLRRLMPCVDTYSRLHQRVVWSDSD
jgi:hypothetical protein